MAASTPSIRAAEIKLLERLSNTCAISGDEGAVRKIVMEEISGLTDEIQIDALGNVLAVRRGKGRNRPKVMLAAHMDEVGFMLTHDEGKGIYRFMVAGGIDSRNLVGKQVLVGKDQTPGVIGMAPIHLTTDSERSNKVNVNNLRIDVGPGNGSRFMHIGPSLRGKALDDRIGVATLILLLRNAPQNIDLMAAFTVQEEVGLRGAKVAAHTLDPDMAFVLDCTPAHVGWQREHPVPQ